MENDKLVKKKKKDFVIYLVEIRDIILDVIKKW